jgi:hypothetical protein
LYDAPWLHIELDIAIFRFFPKSKVGGTFYHNTFDLGVILMFTPCITHEQYQKFLWKQTPALWKENPKRLMSFKKSLSKM